MTLGSAAVASSSALEYQVRHVASVFLNQTQLVFADGFTAVREVPLFRHSAGRAKERHQTDFR